MRGCDGVCWTCLAQVGDRGDVWEQGVFDEHELTCCHDDMSTIRFFRKKAEKENHF